jgi:hypothetical protein
VDLCPTADVRLDLGRERLPWGDATVAGVYAAHCLEHLQPAGLWHCLAEIARVCREGAMVEIHAPHAFHSCALVPGHCCVMGERWVRRWREYGHGISHGRCLEWRRSHYQAEDEFSGPVGRRLLRLGFSEQEVLRLFPEMCHEVYFYLEVVRHE